MNTTFIMEQLQQMKRCMDAIVREMGVTPEQRPLREQRPPLPVAPPVNGPYNGDTLMPFGKHRGVKLKFLPEDYVAWMRTQDMKDVRMRAWLKATDGRSMGQLALEPSDPVLAKQVEEQIADATSKDNVLF